jgi:hypothetical protein
MEGGIYDAQAGPISMENVEAYLKYQSQVESEADSGVVEWTPRKLYNIFLEATRTTVRHVPQSLIQIDVAKLQPKFDKANLYTA